MPTISNESKTLEAANAFRFACPILGVEARLSDCFRVEEKHMIGKRVEGRNACHACMASGKCPTWHIHQETLRGLDEYHGDRFGKLGDRLLARIKPVIVQEQHIDRYAVAPEQADRIRASNKSHSIATGSNGRGLLGAPAKPGEGRAPSKVTPDKIDKPDATLAAAMSGDMSAAVNFAMKNSSDPTTSTPSSKPEGRPMTLLERARLENERRSA